MQFGLSLSLTRLRRIFGSAPPAGITWDAGVTWDSGVFWS